MDLNLRAKTWGVIALSTYTVAGLSAICAITTLQLSLPDSDGASDVPWPLIFFDPFVLMIAVPVVLLGATVVLPFAILALQGTNLSKSIPRVAVATVACAALTGPGNALAIPATLLVGAGAMVWVQFSPRCKLESD